MNAPTPPEGPSIVPQAPPAEPAAAPFPATARSGDDVLRSVSDVRQIVPNVPVVPVANPADAPILDDPSQPIQRRIVLPLGLFLATCVSTFLVGATQADPSKLFDHDRAWSVVKNDWRLGLAYMASIMGILLAHEMGHFIGTLIHRIPASLPYFIPVPISPLGTMGAVIGMEGRRANRRQLFDIGIWGPLAGLIVAVPVMILGVQHVQAAPNVPHTEMTPLYD